MTGKDTTWETDETPEAPIRPLLLIAGLALLLPAAAAQAVTIGVVPVDESASLDLALVPAPRLELVGAPGGTTPPFPVEDIFFDVDLTTAGPGDLFIADASTPGFAVFAERLTNGVDDFLFWRIPGEAIVLALTESLLLAAALDPGQVDFAGFTIDRVEVAIAEVIIEDNPASPPPLVLPTDRVAVTGTLTVIGTPVPEPSTAALVALGTLALAGTRRSRR